VIGEVLWLAPPRIDIFNTRPTLSHLAIYHKIRIMQKIFLANLRTFICEMNVLLMGGFARRSERALSFAKPARLPSVLDHPLSL
jgi:hypothetical protein